MKNIHERMRNRMAYALWPKPTKEPVDRSLFRDIHERCLNTHRMVKVRAIDEQRIYDDDPEYAEFPLEMLTSCHGNNLFSTAPTFRRKFFTDPDRPVMRFILEEHPIRHFILVNGEYVRMEALWRQSLWWPRHRMQQDEEYRK